MAQIVRFHETGDAEVLRIEEVARPEPGHGEVGVEIKSIGVNRSDVAFRQGKYLIKPVLPCGLGVEGAGVIYGLGPEVTGFDVGQRVSILPGFAQGGRHATYGTHGTFPASSVIHIPNSVDDITASAIWVSFLTAWGALSEIGRIRAGDFVAISAASSSVGLAAIQTAGLLGGIPIGITRSDTKAAALRSAGAKHVVTSDTMDVAASLSAISGDKGVKIAFDPIAGPFTNALVPAMADEGLLITYGGLSDQPTMLDRQAMLRKGLSFVGYTMGQILRNPDRFERGRNFILQNMSIGALSPSIDRIFPLEEAVEAHRYMEANGHIGKIVIRV
jgi:NADPH:quinone reductase-like Zn-dependent oxidoreductase